jgi:hypothetical protein
MEGDCRVEEGNRRGGLCEIVRLKEKKKQQKSKHASYTTSSTSVKPP